MGLLETLGIVFIILKLCGVIAWSWGWVLAPFYPAVLVWIGLIFGFGVFAAKKRR
jgi:uncharacterized membrane protein (DUF485 family)